MENIISLVRRYRSAVMGLAIFWVVCNHSGIAANLPEPLRFLAEVGYGGVDIFLFLSGFGLYYSLERDSDEGRFLRRRAEKIFPAYIPVLLVWAVKITGSGAGLHYWLRLLTGNLTGASFWMGTRTFNWYILALPVFYFAAPFVKRQLDEKGRKGLLGLLAAAGLLSVAFWDEFRLVAVSRFPIFILGMYLARMEDTGKAPGEPLYYGSMVLGVGALYYFLRRIPDYLWDYGLWWYPFILITPGLVAMLCRLDARLESFLPGRWFLAVLRKLGAASLEIYLIHVPVFEYLEKRMELTLRLRLAVICGCILAGLAYHWAVEAGKGLYKKQKAKIN